MESHGASSCASCTHSAASRGKPSDSWISTPFLAGLSNTSSCGEHVALVHPSVDGHSGCSPVLAVRNMLPWDRDSGPCPAAAARAAFVRAESGARRCALGSWAGLGWAVSGGRAVDIPVVTKGVWAFSFSFPLI